MQIGKEMAIPSILKIGNGALGKIGGYLKTEGLDPHSSLPFFYENFLSSSKSLLISMGLTR